jgi:MoaE-MoaD fusion protein
MRVRVLAFGVLKELLPAAEFSLDLPENCTVAELVEQQQLQIPSPAFSKPKLWEAIAVAVNQQYAGRQHVLQENDEVALLPPVSGGTGDSDRIFLTKAPIDALAIVNLVKHPEDGAVTSFDGIVRNHTRGRKTLYLFYEAYPEMARQQMNKLAEEAKQRFGVRDVAIVHRLGKLEIGETSVFIAVSAAHRGITFDACRWIIDTLKTTVPIWKKEQFEDGAVWADGDPFPPEIVPEPAS